ncbi:MAG: putative lipid II flippase FtsW [Bacteroidota bacterium]|nr:putative lipid II flippase FtsW [Candidatus Kapabacteria bacterium]MDW8221116.1 putative lipid II flippase FtsW [Bacteroidota bacterium]
MPLPGTTTSSKGLVGRSHIDWLLFLAAASLMLFSVAFVYSASAYFADVKFGSPERMFIGHTLRVLASFIIIILFARIDYHSLQRHSKPLLFFALGCLVFVLAAGTTIKGAKRWIGFGSLSFQPAELAKFALVLHVARLLAEKQSYIKDLQRAFLPILFWISIVAALIAVQPNFSTAVVIVALGVLMLFIGNAHILHIVAFLAIGFLGGIAYGMTEEYRAQRITDFLHQLSTIFDADNIRHVNYQLQQALLAFGNGGLLGMGPGQSRQRDWFLPESYGDFIFSIIGEEYGFIGVTLIVLAFTVIVWRGFVTARRAPDYFGRFLASGITITFALYAFINMGVTTGILPTTGLPLPFISYGGTAILFSAAALGILLNISAQARKQA